MKKRCFGENIAQKQRFWRSGWDSNPRTGFSRQTISSRSRYDHFDTAPCINFVFVPRFLERHSGENRFSPLLRRTPEALILLHFLTVSFLLKPVISSQPRYDHFDTAAQCITLYLCGGEKSSVVCVFGPPGGPAAISDVCSCARAVNGAAPGFGPAPVLPEVYKVFYRIFRFWVFHFVKQHSIIPYVRPAIRMRTADRN